ncbi:MAG: hypothetical protein KatS3mg063_0805 [Tepidiforma sp.]|uniref:hypothetical protein n=1 Tax=Tepidiforma sp. TaxID=2682230 RepID=UPI0021DE18C4|nr:hypothetical protein [Tepidiforma sp.]GIW14952.1 MAG: hypothetical protein KatS3mg063_0805 [Tepidiforma sp.]
MSWTKPVLGIGATGLAFAAAFALHVVAGALGWAWLFGVAVVLIYLLATGFPAIALWAGGMRYREGSEARLTYTLGTIIGMGLTLGALWATNDRSFGTWTFVLAPVLVALVSALLLTLRAWREGEFARAQAR